MPDTKLADTTVANAATTATPEIPASAVGSSDAAKPSVSTKGTFSWGEGWREHIAKGDEKTLNRLKRFQSPEDLWEMNRNLESKMSSGDLKPGLPKDATPEQLAQWRKDNGIPEKPEGYDLTFDDGLVVGEEDKAIINGFLSKAHESNMAPSQVKEAVRWYYDEIERQAAARSEQDQAVLVQAQDELRGEWGSEYRMNVNLIHGLMDKSPDGLKEAFLGGRLADGTPIGSSVPMLKWLAHLARQDNPVATVVPAAGANQGQAIEDEVKSLESMMGNKFSEYWKGPKAEGMQKRYRELVEAREILQRRGRAV